MNITVSLSLMKIGIKLTLAFFGIAFLASFLIGLIAYIRGKDALETESFNKLTAVREMKASQVEDYFRQIHDQVSELAADPTVIQAMHDFRNGFRHFSNELNSPDEILREAKQTLRGYYELDYLSRLNLYLDKPVTAEAEMPSDPNGQMLQFFCIVSNHNKVGEKEKLDTLPEASGFSASGTSYAEAHQKYHPFLRSFLQRFGYYDIFLIDDSTGNIVYTVFKEVDFGSSLTHGPLAQSNIAQAYRAVKESKDPGFVQLVDYQPYHPSYNAPASFIAAPVFENGKRTGVIVFQMPIDRIDDVMTSQKKWTDVGLGKSGETYLVGEDYCLRNQSRFLSEDSVNYFKMIASVGTPQAVVKKIRSYKSSIGLQQVKTKGTESALAGKTGSEIFPDYRGVPVLSAYRPLRIPGLHWVIMSEIDEEEAFKQIRGLRNYLIWGFAGMVLIIIVVSVLISRRITKPLKELSDDAMEVAKGNFSVEINIRRKDEIGILATSFRKMQSSIRRLVEELREINLGLEQKVEERTQEINNQKAILEEKNREIMDSIHYAQRLQHAILPEPYMLEAVFPDHFVLFKPRDIISGDFYWLHRDGDEVWIAVVDCTGHGVPGAMVSMVGANSLNRCVSEFGLKRPAEILDRLNLLVEETFETSTQDVRDGMDICLCRIHLQTRKIEYAGANNALWIVRKGETEMEEVRADKQPIGKYEFRQPFTHHEVQLGAGDRIYLFTDGYSDQFGGPRGKKFKYKSFMSSVAETAALDIRAQGELLDRQFEDWRGMLEQIDDVCVMGIVLG